MPKVKVSKVLGDSMVSRILKSVEEAAASKPRIENFITRFARIYTPIVVAISGFHGDLYAFNTESGFLSLDIYRA